MSLLDSRATLQTTGEPYHGPSCFTWRRRTAQLFPCSVARMTCRTTLSTSPHYRWCGRKRMQKRGHIRRCLLHQLEHKAIREHICRTPLINPCTDSAKSESPHPVLSSSSHAMRSRHTCTARNSLSTPRVGLSHQRTSVSHPLNPVPPSASLHMDRESTREALKRSLRRA